MSSKFSMLLKSEAIRPVWLFLVGIALAAVAIAINGWNATSLMMAAMILLAGGLLISHIHRHITQLGRQSENLREAAGRAEWHYVNVLRRVVRFIEARERYSRGRSQRIGQLAEQIAIKLNLPAEKCSLMNVAGQLHDIGMLAVSEEILNKRSRLGTEEMRAVQRHSEISYEVLRPLECLSGVLEAIRRHHERMNGTGYPANLSGAQIPVEARILAVADAFDAMTHDRPHRAAMSPYDAFMELRRCTPAGYDTACVEVLAGIINVPQLFMTLCGADRKEEATSEWAEEKVEGATDQES